MWVSKTKKRTNCKYRNKKIFYTKKNHNTYHCKKKSIEKCPINHPLTSKATLRNWFTANIPVHGAQPLDGGQGRPACEPPLMATTTSQCVSKTSWSSSALSVWCVRYSHVLPDIWRERQEVSHGQVGQTAAAKVCGA